jgi:hypothetical protein
MYYIVQKNIFQEPNYDKIFEALNKLNLEYEVVEIIPFAESIDFKTKREDVFVYGSVKLAKITRQYDWKPGSFYGQNHDFETYSKYYKDNLLNYESEISEFGKRLTWENTEEKFIRPSRDAKLFTGKKFTKTKWEDFVHNSLSDNQNPLNEKTLIQITKPRHIIKEARIWIIDGQISTSSYYKFHGNIEYEETVSSDGLNFAQEMANLYQVAHAFVMDICDTSDGWKIVEVNCINSAGFYKGNVENIVRSLEIKFAI